MRHLHIYKTRAQKKNLMWGDLFKELIREMSTYKVEAAFDYIRLLEECNLVHAKFSKCYDVLSMATGMPKTNSIDKLIKQLSPSLFFRRRLVDAAKILAACLPPDRSSIATKADLVATHKHLPENRLSPDRLIEARSRPVRIGTRLASKSYDLRRYHRRHKDGSESQRRSSSRAWTKRRDLRPRVKMC